MVQEFEKSSSQIMIASILAANSSISLPFCHALVVFEKTWIYSAYEQMKGRISRATSTTESNVYNMEYENSLDQLQVLNLMRKGAVINSIGKSKKLTPTQWKGVFNGGFKL
jgi:hypothetical protein